MTRRFTLILMMLAAVMAVSAQRPDTLNIVGHITADGVNTVTQPAALSRLLMRSAAASVAVEHTDDDQTEADKGASEPAASKSRVAGYRVQVFSDNNSSTAKHMRSTILLTGGSKWAISAPSARPMMRPTR